MKELLFNTGDNWTGLIVRLTSGLVLLPHGAQKMLGWFGGYGFQGTMNYFTETRQFPWILSLLIILVEFFGSLFLIAGFATRFWAAAVIVLMTGIIFTSHLNNGFFMNWYAAQKGEGYEFHLLMLGLCIALFLEGGGKFSLDRLFLKGM